MTARNTSRRISPTTDAGLIWNDNLIPDPMSKIKQGLWYQCKKSHPYFTEGNYYYAPSDDTLNDNRNRQYLLMPCERSHFGKGEVIRIASPRR